MSSRTYRVFLPVMLSFLLVLPEDSLVVSTFARLLYRDPNSLEGRLYGKRDVKVVILVVVKETIAPVLECACLL